MCKKRTTASKKQFFLLNHQLLCWSPESPLEVPDVKTFRGPSGTSPGRRVPAGLHSQLHVLGSQEYSSLHTRYFTVVFFCTLHMHIILLVFYTHFSIYGYSTFDLNYIFSIKFSTTVA